MYKNNSRHSSKIKGCSPLQLSCNLTGKCHAVGYYSYVCQEAVHRPKTVLHALIEMMEPTHRSRFTGEGFKPPKGATVKSHGTERLGKVKSERLYRYVYMR